MVAADAESLVRWLAWPGFSAGARFHTSVWSRAILDDPRWMFAPPDLLVSTTHPRDELAMPEEAPARRMRAAAVGGGYLFDRYEEEGDDGDQPHVSPARPERGDLDIIGSSSMMPPMHASQPAGYGAPQHFPSAASPDAASPEPFFHATLDAGSLDEVFDMIRAPDTVIMSQAASYRIGRDQRLDPSSSAFVVSPLPFQGMGYTDESAAREPSPPPPPQRPTRTIRPPPCGTGGHLHHGSGHIPQRFSGRSMRSMSFLIRVEMGLPGAFLRIARLSRTDGPYHSSHSRSSRIGGKSIAYTYFTAAMRYTGSQYGPHSIPIDAHAAMTCRHGR
ncbi:hypothetical protein PIB30_069882 [Stylosanthes scabra]|uniref:Uncharacterized protein n=1 Tax=Stylosanthes scabra TaxID=79078 RepID=A0ABU6QMV8_9FABA|nr:hypothetical protein [Stylosanthes scabra]